MGNLLLPGSLLPQPSLVLRAAEQDPADRRLQRLTADVLGVTGDAIQAVFIQIPSDLTIVVIRFHADAVSFWVSDGVPDVDYAVGVLLSLSSGARRHVQLIVPVRALAPALPAIGGHPVLPPSVPNAAPFANPVLIGDALASFGGIPIVLGV